MNKTETKILANIKRLGKSAIFGKRMWNAAKSLEKAGFIRFRDTSDFVPVRKDYGYKQEFSYQGAAFPVNKK